MVYKVYAFRYSDELDIYTRFIGRNVEGDRGRGSYVRQGDYATVVLDSREELGEGG